MSELSPSTTPWILRILLGLAATLLMGGAASLRIDGPGLEYDELHQAAASFAWLGQPTPFFNATSVFGLPLLNMPYSGAVKTTIFGLWMRIFDEPFTPEGWRWLGILLGAPGFLALALLAGRRLRPFALALLLLLSLIDINVLLTLRHDRGPVALAFLLRCIFLGVWIGAPPGLARPRTTFILGLLVGFAIFEKLSSTVLLAPFFVHLWSETRRTRAHFGAGLLGGIIGGLPLLVANLISWTKRQNLVSLSSLQGENVHSLRDALDFCMEYASQSQGHWARHAMHGVQRNGPWVFLEFCLVVALSAVLLCNLRSKDPSLRRAGLLAFSWLAVGVALFLLPERSVEHHWILGTPFLAAAVAAALPDQTCRHSKLTLALASAILLLRIPAAVGTVHDILRVQTSPRWSPSLTRLGELAAAEPETTTFLAADWGVATQIHCLNQGRPHRVHEVYWSNRRPDLPRILKGSAVVYVVASPRIEHLSPQVKDAAWQLGVSSPGFTEQPLEEAYAQLTDLRIVKLVRVR